MEALLTQCYTCVKKQNSAYLLLGKEGKKSFRKEEALRLDLPSLHFKA